jgi:hypothetical protein
MMKALMNRQNDDCSDRARLHARDMVAILLLDEIGPEFRAIVAEAHQSSTTALSAFSVRLLNQDFLQASFPNPVSPSSIYEHCHSVAMQSRRL